MKVRGKRVVVQAYRLTDRTEIHSLEGTMTGEIGEWLITGVGGERYLCKPDIFDQIYEPVEDETGKEEQTNHVASVDIECRSCDGNGLYVGAGERDGAAVVCGRCAGSGCEQLKYTPFQGRKERPEIVQVWATSPGHVIVPGRYSGGVSYETWVANPNSVHALGSEIREVACPASWYQSARGASSPDWPECQGVDRFSDCRRFPDKAQCWEKFDRERQAPNEGA